jgi:hypothetical protein
MTKAEDPLAAWLDTIYFKILRLQDVELPDDADLRLDYSGGSLRQLERLVLDRFGEPGDVSFFEERGFVEGVATYLGESLMRLAGGSWGWTAGDDPEGFPDGMPLVRPDAALRLDPVSPVHLMRDAVHGRDGARFTAVYGAWERAVEQAKQAQPSWRPHKEPTTLDSPEPASDYLTEWLRRRDIAFPDWIAAYAPDGAWDFSPDSLAALAELLRRVTPTKAELYDPANRDFVDGAAWYLGEVMRRGMGGRWNYNDSGSSDRSFPYVEDLGPWDSTSIPVIALENALTEPGHLRAHYDDFAS